MKHLLAAMSISLLTLFSCRGKHDLGTDAFARMLENDNNAQLVDVRTQAEYAEGHLRGAANIDWQGPDFLSAATEALEKSRPVMVYCRSGRRSAAAAAALRDAGYEVFNLKGGILAWAAAALPVTKYEVERFTTPGGKRLEITLIKHGSLEIHWQGLSIQVDPVSGLGRPTDYQAEFPKADIIMVTHEHGDHYDPQAIAALTAEKTQLLTNARCAGMLGYGTPLSNGETAEPAGGISVEAVPAYNTTPGREKFHPKGRDNGYILTIDGLRIYIAGDTEDIPEMSGIKDIDIAFLPVNQPYTMTPEQCVCAAKVIGPKVLIPYHYSDTDLSGIPSQLPSIDVRIRQMQ